MYNRKSNYALNKKDTEAIVYTDADGRRIRLTCDDFGTEDEFLKWKAWSDEDYHNEERGDLKEAKHTLSMEELEESAISSNGLEDILVEEFERLKHMQYAAEMAIEIRCALTDIQFRRLWKNTVKEMTVEEIAKEEDVEHSAVSASISASKKKSKKVLKNT